MAGVVIRALAWLGPRGIEDGKRISLWMIRPPARLTTHGRKVYLQMLRDEPVRLRTLAALRGLNHDLPPPAPA